MIIQFVSKENFQYLVVLASDDLSYCLDIKIEAERKIARKKMFRVNGLQSSIRMIL
jgi:hypothetical protein